MYAAKPPSRRNTKELATKVTLLRRALAQSRRRGRKTLRRLTRALREKEAAEAELQDFAKRSLQRKSTSFTSLHDKVKDPRDACAVVVASAATPNTKSERLLESSGLSPEHLPGPFRKQLLLLYTLQAELKEMIAQDAHTEKSTINFLFGEHVKSKRMATELRNFLGITNRQGRDVGEKVLSVPLRVMLPAVSSQLKGKVLLFYQRDDVSRLSPGMHECVTVRNADDTSRVKLQTRTLTDYLYNLHRMFAEENPTDNLQLTRFSSLRPKNVRLASYIKTSDCLCIYHQNVTLLLKAINNYIDHPVSVNPDQYIRSLPEDDDLPTVHLIEGNKVKYTRWEKAPDKQQKDHTRTQLLDKSMHKKKFCDFFIHEMDSFRLHAGRVKDHTAQMRRLKENLGEHELLIHMDFSENFTCAESRDNVQSSYWGKKGITLHPIVVYYREGGEVRHKSYVCVSPVDKHDSTLVIAILKKFIQEDIAPLIAEKEIKKIHYLTDSPVSQYRNKSIFFYVSNHFAMFGLLAEWHYSEVGHGKGPCDGVGACSKRMAFEAIKRGYTIKDALTFYRWGCSLTKCAITFFYVDEFDYTAVDEGLTKIKPLLTALSGTMLLHSVRPGMAQYTVLWREQSCTCDSCLKEDYPTTCVWAKHRLVSGPASKRLTACGDCSSSLCSCLDKVDSRRPLYAEESDGNYNRNACVEL